MREEWPQSAGLSASWYYHMASLCVPVPCPVKQLFLIPLASDIPLPPTGFGKGLWGLGQDTNPYKKYGPVFRILSLLHPHPGV